MGTTHLENFDHFQVKTEKSSKKSAQRNDMIGYRIWKSNHDSDGDCRQELGSQWKGFCPSFGFPGEDLNQGNGGGSERKGED